MMNHDMSPRRAIPLASAARLLGLGLLLWGAPACDDEGGKNGKNGGTSDDGDGGGDDGAEGISLCNTFNELVVDCLIESGVPADVAERGLEDCAGEFGAADIAFFSCVVDVYDSADCSTPEGQVALADALLACD
jgi:hypothetical protein